MKQSLLFALIFFSALSLRAAPGDTTWVQAHSTQYLQKVVLDMNGNPVDTTYHGNYDVAVTYPAGTVPYRKIYMIFTLGKYSCPGYNPANPGDQPGQTGWCGDWDYTVQNFVMTPAGDTFELGRLITPYARQTAARTPLTWTQRYIFDVTDYYPILKGNAAFRIFYSGYSGGFTADVKFAFIEGTPARNVIGIQRLWKGSHQYGAATPIDDRITAQTIAPPANTQSSEMRFTISGHGSDQNYCSEFCTKYYDVKFEGNQIYHKDIWRDNCGKNHLYPQSGTWLLDRGNWCPGDIVFPNTHIISGAAAGGSYALDVDFEPYSSPGGGSPSYTVEAAIFYYGSLNNSLDASLEDIIAPSNYEGHFRSNPSTGRPTVKVKNTGSATISSIHFEYSATPQYLTYYTWNGTLLPLEEREILLPEPWGLRSSTGSGNLFTAKILDVNGQTDNDQTNNTLTSTYTAAAVWPTTFRVFFKTNNVATGTSWKIIDDLDNVVAQRAGAAPNVTYIDTVVLGPAPYRLVVEDAGCDGLSFWANSSAGSGSVQVRPIGGGSPFPLKGHFGGDFGCGFTEYFHTDWPTSIQNVTAANQPYLEAFPNPAQHSVTVSLSGFSKVSGTLNILDALGRVVLSQQCTSSVEHLNTSKLANGMYTISYTDNSGKLQTRLLIAK